MEQVSHKWNALAKIVWTSMSSLCFTKWSIFGYDYKESVEDAYSSLYFSIVRIILTQKIKPANIKSMDFYDISSGVEGRGNRLLEYMRTKFASLTSLGLFAIDRPNRAAFLSFIKSESAANLKKLKLYGNSYTDEIIGTVFETCQNLGHLTVEAADRLTGSCFEKIKPNLTSLDIKACGAVSNANYISLVKQQKQLVKLYIEINRPDLDPAFMSLVVQNLTKLESLGILINGVEVKIPDIHQLSMLDNLTKLELEAECLNDDNVSKILNECKSLKQFQFEGKNKGLTAEAFTKLPISAPLEFIDVDVKPGFLDNKAVVALKQCAATLKRARLDKSIALTSEGVIELIESCPRLTFLSINDTSCDESVLEKVLNMPDRHMVIICCDAKIDLVKFLNGKDGYTKKFLFTVDTKSFFDFNMRNLKFGVNRLPDEKTQPDFAELESDSDSEDRDMPSVYRVRYLGPRGVVADDIDDDDDDDDGDGDDDDDEDGDDDVDDDDEDDDMDDDDDDDDDEDSDEPRDINRINDRSSESEGEPCNQM